MAAVPSLLAALARTREPDEPSTLGADTSLPSFSSAAGDLIGRVSGGQSTSDAIAGAYGDASASAQAQISSELDSQSSDQATDQRRLAGAEAAADLASKGSIDWDDPQTKEKIIAVIAAAVSYVNPALGVAVELLWQVGKVIATPVDDFFGHIFGYPPDEQLGCKQTGTPMTAKATAARWGLPTYAPGSFQSLLVAALAENGANAWNCVSSSYTQTIVSAMVTLWNTHAVGTPVDLFVPALTANPLGGFSTNFALWIPGPNAGVAPFVDKRQAQYAFLPIDQVPDYIRTVLDLDLQFAQLLSINEASRPALIHLNGDQFRIPVTIRLHGNAGGGDASTGPAAAASSAPSTAGNVARVGAVAAAGGIAAWLALGGSVSDVVRWVRRTL